METLATVRSCAEYEAHAIVASFDSKPGLDALAAFDAPHLPTFTVFVRDADNTGTTYVTAVQAPDADAATREAYQQCRADWSYADDAPLHVLGVAAGDVTILEWDDQE